MTSPPPTYSDAIKDNDELFVTLSDCQYHASLLHTFYNLRIKDPALEKVYLARAERRYYLWMDHVQEFEPSTQILPPIDVIYMWHAHLLSPYRYYEDLLRNGWEIFLNKDYGLPLERLDWAKRTFADGVDPDSEQYWNKFFSDQPYQLTEANLDQGQSVIICPKCKSEIKSSWKGYGKMRTDKEAFLKCSACQETVTVEVLSCDRFVRDWLESTPEHMKLAGFQLNSKGVQLDLQPALVKRLISMRKSESVQKVLKSPKRFHWVDIILALRTPTPKLSGSYYANANEVRDFGTLKNTMRSRYMGIPFKTSIDIIFAVARQWEFTSKMVNINWTTPESVADAIARYKRFLDLMMDHPFDILVPVLSIDLAWHTHMLNHYCYREYTLRHLDLVVNHDDTISMGTINNHLITTAKLWYEKYHEPYTTDDLEKLFYEANKANSNFSPLSIFATKKKKMLRKYWQRDPAMEKNQAAIE
ncbi:hypothetical protein BGW37DRAFT_473163 [Umbelopsis sp. PMI_123]|nr:hypothetical protein BGW37DRAFT_473163 [Umbelopsis sp. PMI_123]